LRPHRARRKQSKRRARLTPRSAGLPAATTEGPIVALQWSARRSALWRRAWGRAARRCAEAHGGALAAVGALCPQKGTGACCCALAAAGVLWKGTGACWFALAVVGVLCPQKGTGACCCALAAAGALWPQEGVGRNTGNHRGGSSEGTKRKRAVARAAAVASHEWQRRRRPLHKAGGG